MIETSVWATDPDDVADGALQPDKVQAYTQKDIMNMVFVFYS